MITIIFAPPRTGKTALMSHFLNEFAFDLDRTRQMQAEVRELNKQGFNLAVPPHCVSANYDLRFFKFGYSRRTNRLINPFRLGYPNPDVDVHLNIPHEVIGIQEAQRYLNSRKSANFPDWQSRWYEQHGHFGIDIFLDTQRPKLIDLNVRELSNFIEVLEMKPTTSKETGKVNKVTWKVRRFDSNFELETYFLSGKKDKDTYHEERIVANYDVFSIYDTHNCKEKFLKEPKKTFELTCEPEDEMPEFFYGRKELKNANK